MKATLEFTLPEEAEQHLAATRAMEMRCAMSEFLENLRSKIKYGHSYEGADAALVDTRRLAIELFGEFAG
ncbi:MAG: hypothetical protein E6Q97_22970 [Desulfurellales bacterium]|nr:MAG: hypothetical protein E6Q97_22970 [Desulfurellales bacterium]